MDFTLNEQIFLFFNQGHTPFLDSFMWMCTKPFTWVPFYIGCFCWLWLKYGFYKAVYYLALIGIAVGLSDFICASIIRPAMHVMRPSNPDNPFSQYVEIVNGYRGGRYGFPSCHAANSFALAIGLLDFARWRFKILLILWAIFICITRMYVGVHYPGDLLAGAAVGSIMGCIVIANRFSTRIPKVRDSRGYRLRFSPDWIPVTTLLLTTAFAAIDSL